MPQRVNRAGVQAQLAAVVPSSPGPDDLDSLSDNYLSLSEEVNGTPPLIQAGDAQYDSLVQLQCSRRCPAVIGSVTLHDGSHRGGGTRIYVLLTQHPLSTVRDAHMRVVPVVLGSPGVEHRRAPLPPPVTAHTHCRAHGLRHVKTATVLAAARKVSADITNGESTRTRRVITF